MPQQLFSEANVRSLAQPRTNLRSVSRNDSCTSREKTKFPNCPLATSNLKSASRQRFVTFLSRHVVLTVVPLDCQSASENPDKSTQWLLPMRATKSLVDHLSPSAQVCYRYPRQLENGPRPRHPQWFMAASHWRIWTPQWFSSQKSQV